MPGFHLPVPFPPKTQGPQKVLIKYANDKKRKEKEIGQGLELLFIAAVLYGK